MNWGLLWPRCSAGGHIWEGNSSGHVKLEVHSRHPDTGVFIVLSSLSWRYKWAESVRQRQVPLFGVYGRRHQ